MEHREGSGRTLVKRHAFGIRPDVYGCLNWVEDGTLLYPVGKTVSLHNLGSDTQRFFDVSVRSSVLTALAISANRKFIAIAEGGTTPQIQIIDSVSRKRRKTLSVKNIGNERFIAIDFSADGRHLVTQCTGEDWTLFFWNWERSKPLAFTSVVADIVTENGGDEGGFSLQKSSDKHLKDTQRFFAGNPPVSCVTICPHDPLLICASGLGILRFYRYVDGVLQPQPTVGYPNERVTNFLTHAWITSESVVASTQTGELLLIQRGVYRRLLPVPPAVLSQPVNLSVLSLARSDEGFVAGTDQGTVAIYGTISGGHKDEYACLYSFSVPTEEEMHLAATAADKDAVNVVKNNGINTCVNATLMNYTNSLNANAGVLQSPSGEKGPSPSFLKNKGMPQRGVANLSDAARPETKETELTLTDGRRENSVVRLAIDTLEENVALVTHSGQILGFSFKQQWSRLTAEESPKLSPICQSFHMGSIIGVDCSIRRPFLVTSGVDRSVRIWNTNTHQLVMCQYFPSRPGPVSIHPSGLYVIICFSDKVYVMSILWNCLHEYRVLSLRNVTDVKYSVGGKYFALAHGNIIHLYNSLTCDLHGQLRGHPQKVSCFQWCATSPYPTDNSMVSCSLDGLIINWSVSEMRKDTEHTDKRFQYKAFAADDKNIWAVAEPASGVSDAQCKVTLREMDRFGVVDATGAPTTTDYEFYDNKIISLVVAPRQRLLFGGMDDGCIKFMAFPLQAGVQETPVVAHMGKATRMALSYDESTVYSVGSDGTLFIMDVREDGCTVQRDAGCFGDEVLVLASDVDDRQITIESLTHVTGKLKAEIEGEEKRRSHEQKTRLREREEEFEGEMAVLDAEYAALLKAKEDQERTFVVVRLEREAESVPLLENLERERQAEVQQLEDECTELQHTLDGSRAAYADEVSELKAKFERERKEEEERFNDVVAKRREVLQKLRGQVQRAKETNMEARQRIELDTDMELETIRERNQQELVAIRERYLRMKGESAIMRKNALRMEKEAEVHANELNILEDAKKALMTQLSELNQRMSQLHQDIEERDTIIGEKEKRIYDFKKLNQELEKHKFVLDYRIRQLKSQMEPRQREIARENQHIKEKNIELENLHQNNITLRQNIDELKAELAQQQVQIKQRVNHMKDFETYKSRVKTDVGELAQAMHDAVKLREVVERLYQRHVVSRDGHRAVQIEQEIKDEFNSQLEYLSTSVEALRRKCKSDQEQHRCEVSAMMLENLSLIREIHGLRAELVELRNVSVAAADEKKRRARMGRLKSIGSTFTDRSVGRLESVAAGPKRPEPPRELEENRAEIQRLREFVEAAQQALAEKVEKRPSSGSCSLPPITQIK